MVGVVISGSQGITDYDLVEQAIIDSGFDPSKIVHGGADGVDQSANTFALLHGLDKERYRPNYNKYNDRAPLKRNEKMVNKYPKLVCVWDEESNGTMHTFRSGLENCEEIYMVTSEGGTIKVGPQSVSIDWRSDDKVAASRVRNALYETRGINTVINI